MDQKNNETILVALAEKIRDLELTVSIRDYDIKKLQEENTTLKTEITRLLGLPNSPIEWRKSDGKL